jgi:hypothetical protein
MPFVLILYRTIFAQKNMIKKSIMPFNWEVELNNIEKVYFIGKDVQQDTSI